VRQDKIAATTRFRPSENPPVLRNGGFFYTRQYPGSLRLFYGEAMFLYTRFSGFSAQ
jgi:hypothetical protein